MKHGVQEALKERYAFWGAKRLSFQGTDLPETCKLLPGDSPEQDGASVSALPYTAENGGEEQRPWGQTAQSLNLHVILSKLPNLPPAQYSHL